MAAITNLGGLFQYSGLLDSLRDAALELHRAGPVEPWAVQSMITRYDSLRDALPGVLDEAGVSEMRLWTESLDGCSSVDGVYWAAAQLARFLDLVHQQGDFLLSQKVRSANALEVEKKVKSVLEGDGDEAVQAPARELVGSSGLYL